jgi:predicted Zn-dependent protease
MKGKLLSRHDERLDAARYYISILNLEAAREILLEYIRDNPANPQAWYLLGQASDDDKLAIVALQHALKLAPNYEDASILLAGIKGDAEMITYPTPPEDDDEPNKDK